MNDAAKIQKTIAMQAQHVGKQALDAAVAKERASHPDAELIGQLDQLARMHGRIEIVCNPDGTIDVRAGGTAAYARNLRNALRDRVRVEVATVTEAMTSGAAGAIEGGSLR